MTLSGTTELYGIIGNPVAHSLSPAMHNSAFAAAGLDKAYLAFPVTDVKQALRGCQALGIKGISVTIPHKQTVIDSLDTIDPVARQIGAVNTLLFKDNGIHGLNTDWIGANRALAEKMALAGSTVVILGAGGSARAIGFGLREAGAAIVLASRTPNKGQALATELHCDWYPLDDITALRTDALVNATAVGMAPYIDSTPVDTAILSKFKIVMDIVYAPLKTRLLVEADKAGCQTIDGLAMLLYQGAAQFEAWTGMPAPITVMKNALLDGLKKR